MNETWLMEHILFLQPIFQKMMCFITKFWEIKSTWFFVSLISRFLQQGLQDLLKICYKREKKVSFLGVE